MKRSHIITSLPIEICGKAFLSSLPMISVPPLVEPLVKTIPRPMPIMAPPKRAARILSPSYVGINRVPTSIKSDVMKVEKSVFTMKLFPKTMSEITKRGILIANIAVPIGKFQM